MTTPFSFVARFALVSTTLLTLSVPVHATDYFATPVGAGAQTGASWSDAYAQSQIGSAVNALAAGDTLYLGSGTYPLLSLTLTGDGAAGSPKSIVGVDTGGGLPLAQGAWDENAPGTTPGGSSYAFRFSGVVSHWVLKDVRVSRYAQAINLVSGGNYSNLTIDNIDADTVRDGIALLNTTTCVVKNCDIVRHTKKGFRLATNVHYVTFENCTADGNGGNDAFPNEAYPVGFFSDSHSGNHSNTFIDCTARNQRMPNQPTAYWNGDGFTTERGSYNYSYIRCQAFDCHDGGFDDKANSVLYDSCVVIGNKRGFRNWGFNGVMVNCLAAYNQPWGDAYDGLGLWTEGSINISQSTFFNNGGAQVYADPGGLVVLNDSILSVDGVFSSGTMTYGDVALNRTVQYTPGVGPDADPNYVAPSRTWTGSPANAFDSQTYTNPEKGYYQAGGTANIPPLVSLSVAPYTSGMAPFAVNFTATPTETDGTIVSYAWTFGDGGTSTAQNPSHTYTTVGTFTAQCTVTDNSGAIGVKQITVQVINANAGPDHYVTPAGAGSQNGSNWANAYGEADLKALCNSLGAGHTVHLGSGTYTLGPSITLTKSGTSSAPITIQGVDTGAGLPLFDGTFNPEASNASSGLFTFGTGPVSYLTIRNLRFQDQGWVFEMKQTGTTDTLRDHITFENITFDTIEDGIRLKNCNNVVVRDCHAIRYTKKPFRVSDYSSFVTIENCSADCTGGDQNWAAKAIPVSFSCDDTAGLPTIHDITFIDCVARHNGYAQPDDKYWNGDGFSSERGAYNISYLRCRSYDNNDGGFDDKANDLLYRDCIAAGNKKQFRIWAANVVLENCLAVNPAYASATGGEGGTSGLQGIWIDDVASVTVRFSTIHNAHSEVTSGGSLTFEDSILSKDSSTTSFWTGTGVTLVRTELYSPLTGTDPQYLAPDPAWRGSPLTSYNSALYGQTKGFHSGNITGGDSEPPGVPTGLTASAVTGHSFSLSWTASTDNVGVTGYEVFRDGVSIATPIGTSVALTDLAANTTYAMTVRATDAYANWSAPSVVLNVTTTAPTVPAVPADLTATASDTQVSLGWTAASGTTSYNVKRATNSGGPFTTIASPTATSHTDTGLTNGITYHYVVSAVNAVGESADSTPVSATPKSSLILDNADSSGITLVGSWTTSTSTPGYYGANYSHDGDTGSTGGKSITFAPTIAASASFDIYARWPAGTNRATNTPIDINHAGGLTTVTVNQQTNHAVWVLLGTFALNAGTSGNVTIRNDGANGYVMADAIMFTQNYGTDTAPPSVPTGLASSTITSDSFTLTWTASSDNVGVTGYEVFQDGVSIATPASTSVSVSGLAASTTYAMTVRARDAAGNWSAQSTALNVTTGTNSFDLTLDNTDAAGIAVTGAWTASTFTPGYYGADYLHDGNAGKGTKSVRFTPDLPSAGNVNVYARWTTGTNRATNVPIDITHAGGTTTVTVDQQQNNGAWVALGTYAFNAGTGGNVLIRTTGTNGFVIADAMRFEKTTSVDTQAPSVPAGLSSSAITTNSFTLTWTASTDNIGVTVYEVFRDGVSIATPSATSVNVTGLSPSTTYAMTVRARDAAGNWSAQSTTLNVTTSAPPDTTPPSVPAGLASSSVTSDSFTLSWTASTDNVGVTGYEIFRDGVSVATPSGTSASITGLSPSTTYAMTVRARDTAGNWSAQSAVLNVTTEPPPDTEAPSVPAGLAVTDLTPEAFMLTWTASTDNVGVTGYEVFVDGVSYATPATPDAAISGLTPGTTYALTVRARDAAGNWSAESAVLFATTPTGLAIGINLGDTANALAAGDIAGAVLASNWNNSTNANETLTDLLDSSGAATTADITFGNTTYAYANNTADPGGSLTDDARLMRSQRAKSNASTMSAVVSQVPYANYDVYVYWGGRTAQETVPHTMGVSFQLWNGTAWVTQETKYIRDDNRLWDATYDESTATSSAAATDGQEFVVFRNVTAATFRIQVDTGVRTGLSGLQIVDQ